MHVRFLKLALLVGLWLTAGWAQAVSPNLVLAYARYESHYGRQPGHSLSGVIRVRNIAPEKKVTVRYTQDGLKWQDIAASYQAPAKDGFELWNFSTPTATLDTPRNYRFALRYQVAGKEYWDNNGGQDYRVEVAQWPVPSDAVVLLQDGPVALNRAYAYGSDGLVVGGVDVKNLAFAKDVRVRYSVDGGQTYTDAIANYAFSHPGNQTERWEFKFKLPPAAQAQFSVLLTLDGATYVDDNFGQLYVADEGFVRSLY